MIDSALMSLLDDKSEDYRRGFNEGWKLEFNYHRIFCARDEIKSGLITSLKSQFKDREMITAKELYTFLDSLKVTKNENHIDMTDVEIVKKERKIFSFLLANF